MKFIATTILLILLPAIGFSQEKNQENTDFNSKQLLKLVAKNSVSTSSTVHTYKLNLPNVLSEIQDDSDEVFENSVEIESIISAFLNVQGVFECSYDVVTQSFFIHTNSTLDLTSLVVEINNHK